MADETVRDIVRRVRNTLQEKGPAGAFLLSELDSAISRGVEDIRSPEAKSSEISGRRGPDESELLELLHSVFQTYLVSLPAVSQSLNTHLRDRYRVDHCEIDLDRSLLGDELQLTGRARVESAVPPPPTVPVVKAIGEIGRIARERFR